MDIKHCESGMYANAFQWKRNDITSIGAQKTQHGGLVF
jgi:hypothetical protein